MKEFNNLLTDAGLEVHAFTFEGCSKNLRTARRLLKVHFFELRTTIRPHRQNDRNGT